jgi:Fe2+ or Zn2+ uptake regulation protein
MHEAARNEPAPRGTGTAPDTLREALLRAGHRVTRQREAVYGVLRSTRSHPTAEELFRVVRTRIPDISLATVYKALEAFENAGLCLRLTHGDGPARYDARVDEHHHLRCVDCDRVVDVDGPAVRDRVEGAAARQGFEVLDCRLVLVGRCAACRSDARAVA